MTSRKTVSMFSNSSPGVKRKAGSTAKAPGPRRVGLAEMKDDFSRCLKRAASEEDWFEYRLEGHPEFLKRVARARRQIAEGEGVPFESLRG